MDKLSNGFKAFLVASGIVGGVIGIYIVRALMPSKSHAHKDKD